MNKLKYMNISSFGLSFFLLVFYFFGQILVLDKNLLLMPEFYRYDFSIILSLSPLFLFFIIKKRINFSYNKLVNYFVILIVLINLPISIFQFINQGYATGFLSSTNSFGGFLISVIFLSLFTFKTYSNRFMLRLFILPSLIIMLFLTKSMGSIYAVLLSYFCLIFLKRNRFAIPISLIFFNVLITIFLSLANYSIYFDNYNFTSDNRFERADFENIKKSNIYHRMHVYIPSAFHASSISPIFGIGIGKYNDIPWNFNKLDVVKFNTNIDYSFNNIHAHNSFLSILATSGLLGLILFLNFWINFFKKINSIDNKDVLLTYNLIYFALTFASFTGDRLSSPTNLAPFLFFFTVYKLTRRI